MDLIFYNGEHSVKFWKSENDHKDSWTDWHLIPTSKPIISMPAVRTKIVELPGINGIIDLTTALTGWPTYGNRTGSLEFILAPGYGILESVRREIANYLHGFSCRLYLADDVSHYYEGTFSVDAVKADARTNGISIGYNLGPFIWDATASNEDWLWDPFNFETDYARDWSDIPVHGSIVLTISECVAPISIIVETSSNMNLVHEYKTYNGVSRTKSYSIVSGEHKAVTVYPGDNKLTLSGNGTATVYYRGGSL